MMPVPNVMLNTIIDLLVCKVGVLREAPMTYGRETKWNRKYRGFGIDLTGVPLPLPKGRYFSGQPFLLKDASDSGYWLYVALPSLVCYCS